jgi:hypothetical protein
VVAECYSMAAFHRQQGPPASTRPSQSGSPVLGGRPCGPLRVGPDTRSFKQPGAGRECRRMADNCAGRYSCPGGAESEGHPGGPAPASVPSRISSQPGLAGRMRSCSTCGCATWTPS